MQEKVIPIARAKAPIEPFPAAHDHIATINLCKVSAAILYAEDLRLDLVDKFIQSAPKCEVKACQETLNPQKLARASTGWGAIVERRDASGESQSTWRCAAHFLEMWPQ